MESSLQAEGTAGTSRKRSRTLEVALCCAALLWFAASYALAAKAARGLVERFGLEDFSGLLFVVLVLFLVVTGYGVIDRIGGGRGTAGTVLTLPRRKGWHGEFGVGAALGWGMAVVAVLPVLLSGNLHARIWVSGRTVGMGALGLVTLALICLLEEIVARGYAFRRLIAAMGEAWATVVMSVGFGVALVFADPPFRVLTALACGTIFGLLLSIAFLRTQALWFGWGLHFAYRAAAAALFGLPIVGRTEFSSVVESYTTGRQWLGGGDYGIDAALLTILVLLAGTVVLFRTTREYAWNYTHVLPVPAGYAVEVPPPAVHVAMEKSGETAAPALVQILSSTPQTMSKGEAGPE